MKSKIFAGIITLIAIFISNASSGQSEYMIGEGDLLKITVYDNGDLTTETRVSGEGKISLPLIGEVLASGSTAIELEKKIAGLLEDGYIVKPQVSVFIEEYKSRKVSILGEVAKPGFVILRGESTLLDVISDAGGLTQNVAETLTIQRKQKQEVKLVPPSSEQNNGGTASRSQDKANKDEVLLVVSLKKLFDDGDVTANLPVMDGDSIYVPRASFVYVNGEVKNPGAYKITKGLTVLKSITLAGGFTDKASQRRTKIIRKTGKGEETIKIKMDDIVMPDDIVVVPESFF